MRKRRWWIAVILSLAAPGLGHIYAGRPRRGFVLAGAFAGIFLLMGTLSGDGSARWLFIGYVAIIGGLVGFQLFSLVDVGLIARKAGEIRLGPLNKIWIYLCVICCWAVFAGLAEFEASFVTFSIPSGSMYPTIQVGDYILVSKDWYRRNSPERGELATLLWPKDNKTVYVKRIVGLPGDKIQMVDDHLWINGAMVDEQRLEDVEIQNMPSHYANRQFVETIGVNPPHRIVKTAEYRRLANTEIFEVPAETVFTLGDNRDNSLDSRVPISMNGVGFVPYENLLDRPRVIVWSRDWHRIGQAVD